MHFNPPIAWEPSDPSLLANVYNILYMHDQSCRDKNERILRHLDSYLPAVEPTFLLRVEADVVRASVLYLLHPINFALRSLSIEQLFCLSEMSQGPTARTDIAWTFQDKWNNRRTLAVLEFKNTYMLRKDEFYSGKADMSAEVGAKGSPVALINDVKATPDDGNSWLGSGARTLSRQMMKYSRRARTDFVAIFDWKALFIYDFSTMDEKNYQLARGTWFVEDPLASQTVTFRTLLMGMLIEALRRRGLLRIPLPPPSQVKTPSSFVLNI